MHHGTQAFASTTGLDHPELNDALNQTSYAAGEQLEWLAGNASYTPNSISADSAPWPRISPRSAAGNAMDYMAGATGMNGITSKQIGSLDALEVQHRKTQNSRHCSSPQSVPPIHHPGPDPVHTWRSPGQEKGDSALSCSRRGQSTPLNASLWPR